MDFIKTPDYTSDDSRGADIMLRRSKACFGLNPLNLNRLAPAEERVILLLIFSPRLA